MGVGGGGDAGDAGKGLMTEAQLLLLILGHQQHGGGAVGDGAHIELAQGIGHHGAGGVYVPGGR